MKNLRLTSAPILTGIAIATATLTAFFYGIWTSIPGKPDAHSTMQSSSWPNKGERTQPPGQPPEPEITTTDCIPIRVLPSQETGDISQGTQMPACPNGTTMILNIQTQVNLKLNPEQNAGGQ